MRRLALILSLLSLQACLSGCSVLAVADAAVTVVATTVSVGATVVGTAVDVTAAGVKAVAGTDDEEDDADEAPRVEAGDAAPQAALHTAPQP